MKTLLFLSSEKRKKEEEEEMGEDDKRRTRDYVEQIKLKVESGDLDEIRVFRIDSGQNEVSVSSFGLLWGWASRLFLWLLRTLLPVVIFFSALVFILFALFLLLQLAFGWNPFALGAGKEIELTDDDLFVPAHICVISLVVVVMAYFAYSRLPESRSTKSGKSADEETNVYALKKLLDARELNLTHHQNVNKKHVCVPISTEYFN